MLHDLPQGQVEVHLALPEQLEVAAAPAGLGLALDPVGQLQLDQARLEAHGPHGGGGGGHLDTLEGPTTQLHQVMFCDLRYVC